MAESQMYNYVEKINKFKPVIIEAYVQSIFELSRFIKEKKLTVYSPQGIVTSAGTLYPEMKKEIEEVFQTKVYNRYGSREVGDIACSCDRDEGLHLNVFQHYVEILNDKLEPCDAGEIGKVYVTRLDNFSMPLIRYDIGDLAAVARDKKCTCGRGLPLIKNILGRNNSIIRTKNGAIDSVALSTSLYAYKSIQKYQFVQKRINYFVIKVIINNQNIWEKEKIKMENKLKKILGEDAVVDIEVLKYINPLSSGKYQYIISEII